MENKMAPPPYNQGEQAYPPQPYPQQYPPQYPPQYPQQSQPQFAPPPVHTNVIMATPVITMGGCPSCRVGVMQDDFTCCGIFLAIFFFPIGILCCLVMRDRRCSNCGASFS